MRNEKERVLTSIVEKALEHDTSVLLWYQNEETWII